MIDLLFLARTVSVNTIGVWRRQGSCIVSMYYVSITPDILTLCFFRKKVSMIYSVICDKRKLMSRFNWKEVNIENFQSRHFVSAFFTCITASFFFAANFYRY